MPKNHWLILIFILCVYFFIVTLNLVRYPVVMPPDEAAFSSTSYSLIHKNELGDTDFEKRLPRIDKTPLTHYGPTYIFSLAVPIELFGYSIYTIRYFSVFIGLLSLIVFFSLVKKSTPGKGVFSFLAVLLVGIDFFFLNSAKLGRMDILAVLFQLLAYLFYLKTFHNQRFLNYFFVGLFATAALFTHFISGIPAIIAIGLHSLLFNRSFWKRKESFVVPVILTICMIMWFIYLLYFADKSAITASEMLIGNRLIPKFSSIKLAFKDNIAFSWVSIIVYGVGFFLVLFKSRKNIYDTFWLIVAVSAFMIAIWGDSFWYLSVLPVSFIPLLFLSERKKGVAAFSDYNFVLRICVIIVFASISLYQQIMVYDRYRDFSYEAYGEGASRCVTKKNANVLLYAQPDPFFFFVAHRDDIKIGYKKYPDVDGQIFRKSLKKADYLVVSEEYELVLKSDEYKTSVNDPIKRAYLNDYIYTTYAVEPELLDYIDKNKKGSCIGNKMSNFPTLIVYRLR